MAKITINGISIDPSANGPALAGANLISADSAASNFILVQAKQPLDESQKNQLAMLGTEILEYVPENAYICHYPPSDLSRIRSLPFVEWANTYLQPFKVATSLRPAPTGARTASLLALTSPDTLSKDRVAVDVVLHKRVSADSVKSKIAAAAGLDQGSLEVSRNKVRITVERRRLSAIALIDEVRHIEPYIAPRLSNNVARTILQAGNPGPGGQPLEGDKQVIAIADTGFDKGAANDVHPAFGGRVLRLYALGRANDASDPDGHGTHVAGSVLGDGIMHDGTAVRGTAPKASLVFQSVLDSSGDLGGLPDDLNDLFSPPYQDDQARVHTNSWGAPVNGRYTSNSSEVDEFVWDHRDAVICFAAGNDGKDSQGRGVVDPGSIGSPGTAKNCITVGACENNRPHFSISLGGTPQALLYGNGWPSDFPADPIHRDEVANNPDGMAAFSSRGPTANNRVKPDLLAPGTAILSTRSRIATGTGWGTSADPLYFFDGGTSMATPLVAGCAAVIREHLQKEGVGSPSAALVKAMLINGAKIIPGQYVPPEVGAPPDISEGFGRVDLAATVGPYRPGETVIFKDEANALSSGQEEHLAAPIPSAGRTLKVTLVWTDPAGEALQNDLDLIVIAGGQERHGNVAAGSTAFDRTNNVEQVIWSNVPAGNVDIAVRAFRILVPQSYALVVRVS